MGERGLAPFPGRDLHPDAEKAIEDLARRSELPTAVIAYDDHDAARMMRVLAQRGLRVPGDVSVAGANAMAAGAILPTRLTRMWRPHEEMNCAAVEALMALMKGNAEDVKSVTLDPELETGGRPARRGSE